MAWVVRPLGALGLFGFLLGGDEDLTPVAPVVLTSAVGPESRTRSPAIECVPHCDLGCVRCLVTESALEIIGDLSSRGQGELRLLTTR
jgi:hypothetical protein